MKFLRISLLLIINLVLSYSAIAEINDKQRVEQYINANKENAETLALTIANIAELGYQEHKSATLMKQHLKQQGFSIESSIAAMPTSFIASFGHGKPVIGYIAEFDALPGFSQAAVAHKEPKKGQQSGHACGHHLLGTAALESAIAVKKWMSEHEIKGTLKVFGSPAEEGGGGKVYLARAGEIDDVDVMLNWHPASFNNSNPLNNLANFSGKFRFYGQSAHAAATPEKGRSALDAAEAMNFMVNSLREHVDQGSRIHYVITHGGQAPNVVPDFAEVYYYARHNNPEIARNTWHRIERAAKGAALGTDTRVEIEITNATYSILPNSQLSQLVHRNLSLVGGVVYDENELAFAKKIQQSLAGKKVDLAAASRIEPFNNSNDIYYVSSDVGDISWQTPTNWLNVATWVPGTAPHSWQAVVAGTMSIGLKGMHVASKTMALSSIDLLTDAHLLQDIKQEFYNRRGVNFTYQPLLGERQPPLDYRKSHSGK